MAQAQGIPSLMPGQAPGAGQANPMPGMQPPMGGPSAGVVDLVGPLKNLPEQVLTMELMNPQSKLEKYAVLAALDQKNRERKTMQAVQGMMAQQQNAQMQGQGTVAQQVAQEAQAAEEPVMAALGGLMRSYAGGGGVVAFQNGGDALEKKLIAQGVPSAFIAQKKNEGLSLTDIEVEARREGYLPPMPAQTSPVTSLLDTPSLMAPQAEPISPKVPPIAAAPVPTPASEVKTSGIAKIPVDSMNIQESGIAQWFEEPPTSPIPVTPAKSVAPVKPELPAELRAAYERRIANAGLSPEQLKLQQEKQAEEMQVRRSILEAAQKRAKTGETRAKEDYETEKAGIPQLYEPEFFFRLASGISNKRGEEFSSLSKAFADFMAEQRKAQTAVRKDYRAAQDAADRMRAASETIQLATVERDSAIASRNIDQARAAQDKIDQAGLDYEKAKYDREQAAAKAILDERRVKADEDRAKAEQRRAAAYENRPDRVSDLESSYQIELNALLAEGAPDTPATRRKARRTAEENLGRTAPGIRARTGQLTAANKEFVERAMSDPSLRGLRGQDRIDALDRLRGKVEEKYGVAPDAPDPTPSSAAPAAKPAAPPAAVPPIAMPAKESELKDGAVYETRRGPARWDAAKKQFFPV